MRIVIATDGSAGAGTALDLVTGLGWPAGTTARIVTALDTVRVAAPWAAVGGIGLGELETTLLAELQSIVDAAAVRLEAAGIATEGRVVMGRPSLAVTDEARDSAADLIVIGSRGLGSIRTALLGSVSAEVVDSAPCPVLVARDATIGRLLLAHDGSDLARAAEALLAHPPFATLPVEVVSVMAADEPGRRQLLPAGMEAAWTAHDRSMAAARAHHEAVARDAADRLGAAGRAAGWTVPVGDPASALVEEAVDRHADLLVLGTHGRTGLDRFVLGSVARRVLTHAGCSVLVVPRPTAPVAAAAVPVTAGA